MTKPLYFYNGTTFEEIGPTTPQSPIAYQTSAPTGPATGDLWIDSDGDVDTYNRQLTRYYFVATAGQTTITGIDANGLTLAYVAGSEAVYVNGALQVRGQDYTATDGTSVVMSSALAVNDVVEIFAYTAFTVANAYTKSETDGLVGVAPGLKLVVPSSVSVGSGSGSVSTQGTVTFSGASSVSLNGAFSSTYKNYYILLNISSRVTASSIFMRVRASTTDNSSTNYNFGVITKATNSTTIVNYAAANSNTFEVCSIRANGGSAKIDLFDPQTTDYTSYMTVSHSKSGAVNDAQDYETRSGSMSVTTSYDGITIYTNAGTITGTVSVYGYKN
jgi:hypothetical protein